MKKNFLIFLISLGFASINNGCTTKDINLIIDNPVEITTEYVESAFTNEFLDATIIFTPKDGKYPVDYSLKYELIEGEGVYELNEELFSPNDSYKFTNSPEISINLKYTGTNEGVHQTRWILSNNYGQEFYTTLVYNLKKNPDLIPNTAPIAVEDNFTTKQEISILMNVLDNDNDKEGDTIKIFDISSPDNGIASIINNKISYTPNDGFVGEDLIEYTIIDEKENIANGIVNITVLEATAGNLAPIAKDDQTQIDFNTEAIILILENDNDPEGTDLNLVSVETPANGTAVIDGISIVYKPNLDFVGNEIFNYTVKDKEGLESTAKITVNVIGSIPNEAPIANADQIETAFETTIIIDAVSNDVDKENEQLTIIEITNPANGTAVIINNKINYTPAIGFFGSDTFQYVIEDESAQRANGTVTITTKENPNNPPVLEIDAVTTKSLQKTIIDALANDMDPDNDPLIISAISQPAKGSASIVDNKVIYTSGINFSGDEKLIYTVIDNQGNSAQSEILITVELFEVVAIEDENFEKELIFQNLDSDKEVNGYLSKKDALAIEILSLTNEVLDVKSLNGIENFKNLISFTSFKDVSDIDLSQNTKLETVILEKGQFSSLDFSSNIALKLLAVGSNENLTSVNLTKAINLEVLNIYGIPFMMSIDLSQNTNLDVLTLRNYGFDKIDLSNNLELTGISLSNGKLESIDLKNNIQLKSVRLVGIQLIALDTSTLKNLAVLQIQENQLTELDLTKNNLLINVDVSDNKLQKLILYNNITGDSDNIPSNLSTKGNVDLFCIQISDPDLAMAKFGHSLDAQTSYSKNCNY